MTPDGKAFFYKGSSAIQIVTALQPKVKHLFNYVRGQTWISATFVQEQLHKLGGPQASNCKHFSLSKCSDNEPVLRRPIL